MFDVPVDDREAKKAYRHLRRGLIRAGFRMLQYSVYGKHHPSEAASEATKKAVVPLIPKGGRVRMLAVTDHQFAKMETFLGKEGQATEEPLSQLLLL